MQSTRWLDLVRPRGVAPMLLPSLCAICHGWGRQRFCTACIERFAPPLARCERCALPLAEPARVCGACIVDPPPFQRTLAAVDYGYPWDRLIAGFKFHAALDLGAALTELMLRRHRNSTEPAAPSSASTLLLPVPLSAARLRERGYNQAWELARRLAPTLRCAADPALLIRTKDTPHQLALPPDKRAANVRGAFAVEPRRVGELSGRRTIVVDDVMTSGATAAEVARTLLGAGAASVDIWVVARTLRAPASTCA